TTLQVAIAATLIVIPIFRPERLAFHVETPLVFTPPPPRPPLPVARSATLVTSMSSLPVITRSAVPSFIHRATPDGDTPPAIATTSNGWGTIAVGDTFLGVENHGVAVSIAPAKPPAKPMRISAGVSAGMLIAPIRPLYPAIARAAHVSGSVVVEAVISKMGTIESLHIVRGPEMLRTAAMDAIRAARYQPYRLNGEPTEVQTTITVNFTMEG
ncbi:MAG TPA: energy transducer TonB, partial [Edaphobacter sp.]|nr:energy transducer TonB [Edaphobacter sp.]